MANYWDYAAEFKNDLEELLVKIKERVDELSKAKQHIIAAVTDERKAPAKGVVFYAPAHFGNVRKDNANWQKVYFEARAEGDDQPGYKKELFDKIRDKLNNLPPSQAFAAKLALSDSNGGKATIALYYPTAHIPHLPLGSHWQYHDYFKPHIENVSDSLHSALNAIPASFSLLAYADEDKSDAKGVVYYKVGLESPELAQVGHAWNLKKYSTKASGDKQSDYEADLFDQIKTDLNSLSDQHLRLAQLFLTDRSGGKAHICLLHPTFVETV